MKIKLLSVMVTDQDQALQFYTGKLGFIKKTEIPMGEHRWLTVVSPEEPDGTEIVLEPMAFAAARTFQQALKEAGSRRPPSRSQILTANTTASSRQALYFPWRRRRWERSSWQYWMIPAATISSFIKSYSAYFKRFSTISFDPIAAYRYY